VEEGGKPVKADVLVEGEGKYPNLGQGRPVVDYQLLTGLAYEEEEV
jgi:hypothetical protein